MNSRYFHECIRWLRVVMPINSAPDHAVHRHKRPSTDLAYHVTMPRQHRAYPRQIKTVRYRPTTSWDAGVVGYSVDILKTLCTKHRGFVSHLLQVLDTIIIKSLSFTTFRCVTYFTSLTLAHFISPRSPVTLKNVYKL